MPTFLEKIFALPFMPLVTRVLLTFMFWASGLFHLIRWNANVGVLTANGWGSPVVLNAAIVATNLIGSALIIQGRFAWLGALGLMVFTALTVFLVHNFWTMQPPAAIPEMLVAFEHVTVIGALVLYLLYEQRSRSGSRA